MPIDIYDVVLDSLPGTKQQIADTTGLSATGVWRAIQELYPNECFISGWEPAPNSFRFVPVYSPGTGDSAPYPHKVIVKKPHEKPIPKQKKERPPRTALAMALLDQSRHIHLMQDDVLYVVKLNKVPVHREPLVAALFGEASI